MATASTARTGTELIPQGEVETGELVAQGNEWLALKEQAKAAIKSGLLPRALNTPEKVIVVMLTGRELGVPPMHAIRSIHVIDQRPALSAELMLALAFRRIPGFTCHVEGDDKAAKVTACRPNGKPVTVSFTMEDAKRAGLTAKDNWTKYPAAMLRSRAISAAMRIAAPDAIMGLYTPDEVEGLEEAPAKEEKPLPAKPVYDGTQVINEEQRSKLWAFAYAHGKKFEATRPEVQAVVREILARFGCANTEAVTLNQYGAVMEAIGEWQPGEASEPEEAAS